MSILFRHAFYSFMLILAVHNCPLNAADLNQLLQKIPTDSNALVIVNTQKIFASPIATEENWKQGYRNNFRTAPLLMPPDAEYFVLGAHMDYPTMTPTREISIASFAMGPVLEDVVKNTMGTKDMISGLAAIETARDMTIVQFDPNTWGAYSPSNRQAVAQWINAAKMSKESGLSPYLQAQAEYPEKVGTEIILAFDLTNLFRPEDLRKAISASPAIKKSGVDVEKVVAIFQSIQGVTLGVRITDRVFGKIKIDFTQDTSILKDVAQALLPEMASEGGMMLEDYSSWKAGASGTQLTWEGELTRPGLRKIFSFMELEGNAISASQKKPMESGTTPKATEGATPKATEDNEVSITKQYFESLDSYLNDLSHEKGASSFGTIGLWFDKYAKKIEKLPTLHVDNELVDFGYWVSQSLHQATASIQGVGIRSGAREAQVTPTVYGSAEAYGSGPYYRYGTGGYRWRPYGSGYASMQWEATDVASQRRAISAEERATGATQAREIMAQIKTETEKMRRKMTEKYQVQF